MLYWMRRRKRRAAYVAAEDISGSSSHKELPTGSNGHQSVQSEPFEMQDAQPRFEMQDAQSGGYHRRELHEDWVRKYEMPDSGPPIRYELGG